MRIEDLVSMDIEGDFRSDVQLSDFDNRILNRELLKNYIFTIHAPETFGFAQRDYAAKDVLDVLKTAFTVERYDNRIVLTANFGHGKSHLALVLANFFARPYKEEDLHSNDDEVQIILKRLKQALNNPAQFAGYCDFKKSKGEFLVVCLQGDSFNDLQEGFVYALEHALKNHDATKDLEIPFWYRNAETWLNNLNGELLQKAENFLATQKTDLPSLMANIRGEGAYELVRELAKNVTGMYPDFGRETNLEELVTWAIDEVCIPNKLGGLLILFDEFSLFLQKYMTARSVGKLQELLNGIAKRQGKSAFLAFSQHDVDTIAETYAQGQRRDDVKKELERLPKDKRARLYSLMEGVLSSYLQQNKSAWEPWFESVKPFFIQARENVLEHFGKHYSNDLQWDIQVFDERVLKGCFPFHPLTTAIVSTHNFESGAGENPRTALQFVRRTWQDLRNQPAQLPDGKPNLVFPIALVDFYGKQISKKWYEAYRNTFETAPKAFNDEQQKILQALLIQQAVGIKAFAGEQIGLLSHLSGLERKDVKRILIELAKQKTIQSDPINKFSQLWPTSIRHQEVEEVIQKAAENAPIDHTLMAKITSSLQSLEISLDFGNASDWSPRQIALTSEMLTVEELKKQLQPYHNDVSGIVESPRGLIVWLIAQSEEEKTYLRRNAQSFLDEILENDQHPLPVVIMLPKLAVPALVESARLFKALENLKTNEREKIGTVMYQHELGLAEVNFKNSLDNFVGDTQNYADYQRNFHEYAIPSPYRASVQALKNPTLKSVLTECYRQAYPFRVEFYTQYPVIGKGVNQLRAATQNVTRWLFTDTAGNSIRNLANKDIKYQLSNIYLTQKWGLLAVETYAIQRPSTLALQQAWDLLENTFKPGCKDVIAQLVFTSLLNPPYGHDYNTLTLLIAAWIGFHQYEINLYLSGKSISINQLIKILDDSKSPQDFLNKICVLSPLAISRSKPDEIFEEVNVVLEQIRENKPFSIIEAEEALVKLKQTLINPRIPDAKREEIERFQPRLEEALQNAQDFDFKAGEWLERINTGGFDDLIQICGFWGDIPTLSLVLATFPPIEELQKKWETSMQDALNVYCNKYTKLDDLADYKNFESQLKRARKSLDQFPKFIQQVDNALEKLSQCRQELNKRENEKTIIAQINSMKPSASLKDLYGFREELSKWNDLTPQTTIKRDEKLSQIELRINQYEQLAENIPQVVEEVTQLSKLREQRDLLLKNLEQIQGTSLYPCLIEVQQKMVNLETFFEKLNEINKQPLNIPDDQKTVMHNIFEIENQFCSYLSPVQKTLIEKAKQEIEYIRTKKIQEAHSWMIGIVTKFKEGENPEILLHRIEALPSFLNQEDLNRLMELKQILQKRLEQNVLLQIEGLFQKIKDPKIRRQCLTRLQALMDKYYE